MAMVSPSCMVGNENRYVRVVALVEACDRIGKPRRQHAQHREVQAHQIALVLRPIGVVTCR